MPLSSACARFDSSLAAILLSDRHRGPDSHNVLTLLEWPQSFIPTLTALVLLIIPATQAAVDFMNNLTSYLAPPRFLPKLDFSDGIPADCATMVAVPTLLLKEKQVRQLALDLEIRYPREPGSEPLFRSRHRLTRFNEQQDERDTLVDLCSSLIKDLNARYPRAGERNVVLSVPPASHLTTRPKDAGWDGSESAASFSI